MPINTKDSLWAGITKLQSLSAQSDPKPSIHGSIICAADAVASVNIKATPVGEAEPTDKASRPQILDAALPAPESNMGPATELNADHALARYSLIGRSSELEAALSEESYVLPGIALRGQGTMLYASANTGKTLLTMHLLSEGVRKHGLNPRSVFYVNVDDTASGLVEKLGICEELGINMLSEGYREFSAPKLLPIIELLTLQDEAKDSIVVVDTLKRFTDLMDKRSSAAFTKAIRAFVLKGGTFIALAHTNKNRNARGKSVYGGTSDFVDDMDCAYILDELSVDAVTNTKVVEFTNIKLRGNVARTAAFSYSTEPDLTYVALLLSVQPVDPAAVEPIRQAAKLRSDVEIIASVEGCIRGGINTKMLLVQAVAKQLVMSQRSALTFIEAYTGDDPTKHRWSFSVRARGAKVYELLNVPVVPAEGSTRAGQ